MAYSPKVDEMHWASVNQQWLVWRHDAQCRAQACKTERLPEPLLTEVFNKLHSLDHLWKIACDYRADHKGRPEVSKRVEDAMTKDLQQKKITRAELRDTTEEALAKQYDASRDTVRKA
jgi:hypothetical protein